MKEIPVRVAVAELRDSGYFKVIVEAVRKMSPIVPSFNYKGETNIEEIKAKLAQRTMHENIMSLIDPKGNGNE